MIWRLCSRAVRSRRPGPESSSLRVMLFLPARQHRLEICVIRFRFRAADEADFLRFAGGGDADALRADLWFLFAVVIVKHRILIIVDGEIYRRHIELGAEVA